MCNLYQTSRMERLSGNFPLHKIPSWREWADIIGPLKTAPFIKQGFEAVAGQWGMIPPNSETRTPSRKAKDPKTGKDKLVKLSTNNARRETIATAWTYRSSWASGRRCLIPAEWWQEPFWGPLEAPFAKSIPWHFRRADGAPWALAGLWNEWTDPATGEVVPNFTMITQNCDAHALLAKLHKPERDKATGEILPAHLQDKRAVVPIERENWDAWLHGTADEAESLIVLPGETLIRHGAANTSEVATSPASLELPFSS